jgi:hypothetical protein
MGWETANIHFGSPKMVREIRRHLKKQRSGWLHAAAKEMAKAVTEDWRAWKKSAPG